MTSRSASSIAISTPAAISSTPPTCTAAAATRSSSARRSAGRRDVVLADEVRQRPRPERRVPRRPRRPAVRPGVLRRQPQAAGRRGDRPLLPAPRRSEDADRGDRRRDGRAGEGGEGALPRAVRSRAGDDSAGGEGPSHRGACRRSIRSGAASRKTRSCRRARAGHRVRRLQPARPRLSHRASSRRSTTCRPTTTAATRPVSGRELREEPRARQNDRGDGRREGLHAEPARARLGAGAGRRHRADPRHEAHQVPVGGGGGGGGGKGRRNDSARAPRGGQCVRPAH